MKYTVINLKNIIQLKKHYTVNSMKYGSSIQKTCQIIKFQPIKGLNISCL